MRIGVVAHELEGHPTGVGRYLAGLLAGVAETAAAAGHADDEWVLFFRGDDDPALVPPSPPGGPRFRGVFDRRGAGRPVVWEQLRLPRRIRQTAQEGRFDLLFSPAYSLPPWTGVPGVVTVHDLSFELLPEELSFRERWRRRILARWAARSAVRVLVDTAAIGRDLARAYRIPLAKIGVVPLGVEPKLALHAGRRETVDEDRARLAAAGIAEPFLLAAGSIFRRRRLDLAIQAFAAVAGERPELDLVIAGADRLRDRCVLDRWIAASGAGNRIRRVGYVPEDLLAALYRRAELSFYLSAYEGWGLPPLESLAAGTPAVVASGLALDDLWPEYPYRCRVLDAGTVATVVRRALGDGEEQARVVEEAGSRLASLTWPRAALRFLAELDTALGG